MKVRMVQDRTGPRHDGQDWPGVGGVIELDDEEGAAVCAAGWAVPVAEQRKAETGEAKRAATEEKRAAPKAARQG